MISKVLVAASTKPLILSILMEGESYGYQIIQRVKKLSGGKIKWSDGMLYPVLQRLEKEGLVTSRWRMSAGGRHRKYYNLMPKGEEALVRDMQEWQSVNSVLSELWQSTAARSLQTERA
jgi:PadR family transcriptional regulator PadR